METTLWFSLARAKLTHLAPAPVYNLIEYSPEEYALENGYFSNTLVDIAVTNVMPLKTVVGEGYSLSINVTVENQGGYTETFNVTVYDNSTTIGTQSMTTASRHSSIITFTWNTTGFVKGNYDI